MLREEHYHRLHGETWWARLRDGTPESRARLSAAARALLPPSVDLFGETQGAAVLLAAGILPEPTSALLRRWRATVCPLLAAQDAALPPLLDHAPASRSARPLSADFAALHGEMTMVSASGLGERW
jgi:1,2-phenylacetyl-CoA epoxidase catalytic subunit